MPRIAQPIPIPAPWGGMNTRDGIGALQPQEARYLENLDPAGNAVRPRKGQRNWSTGAQSLQPVKTLAAYNGLTGQKLIGVCGGSIWDFSSATAIELSASAFTDNRFQAECYNNYLIAVSVNGAETPWAFDGSTVGGTGFLGSGLTLSNLVNVRKVRNRLWFCEKDSADVWYGEVGAITGTLTKFQLSQVAGGGTCIAIGAHSQDAGDGLDDYAVFVMSTGEVIIYSGDPSTTFTKVGNYSMPIPVGKQCLVNVGGPLAVLTQIGLVPVQAAVSGIAFDVLALGNYGKVSPSVRRDYETYGSNEGWQAVTHEGRVIINIPTTDETASKQWVYNALTGGWTVWTGIDAACFCVQDGLFFGAWGDGVVKEVDGYNDDGDPIELKARCAFAASNRGLQLKATGVRFDVSITGALSGKFGLDVNYVEGSLTTYPTIDIASSTASTPWGSDWGSEWSTSSQYGGQWLSAYSEGHVLGLALEATTNASTLEWLGAHILAKPMGI